MTPNRKAFLDMIAFSEGTSTSPVTKCNGYDVIVTGIDGKPEIFTDFSTHPFANGRPPKVINKDGLRSDAAGRYQEMMKFWPYYQKLLRLPDFGPESQDRLAIQLIGECHALALIDAGRFAEAINACRSRWASLPGAGYKGQHENTIEVLHDAYLKAGGKLA